MRKTYHQITIDTYDKIAKEFSDTRTPSFWQKEFQLFTELVNGKKIIDIGCGTGRDAALFVKNGFDYTGIDASGGMLRQARQKKIKGAKFKKMDFFNLKFKNTFDGFWAAASLLHVSKYRIKKVLFQIGKITKPDAVGFITIRESGIHKSGLLKQERYGAYIKRYFQFYERKEFKKILEESGFSIIKMRAFKEGGKRWLCYFVNKDKRTVQ